jgi:S1-C subfamily serine protease
MTAMSRGVVALAFCAWTLVLARSAVADDSGPSPAQRQAMYAKPSVVRVIAVYEVVYSMAGKQYSEFVGGMGSGFFISSDGFIATNAHVVQDINEGIEAAKRKTLQQILAKIQKQFPDLSREEQIRLLDELRFVRANPTAEVVLPDGTRLPYVVKAYGAPVGEGKDVAIIKVESKNAPNLVIGDSEKMQVQDKVLAIGYPGAADLQGLLDSKSQLEASITDGAVSAKKRTTDGEPVLQVSVPITHGNSGGPAINDRGEVIGLTTFGSKNEVQGFNFLVAASTVMKFVKDAKADTAPSATQKAWRKALDEFWTQDYDAAITDLEEVMTLFPAHSEAPRFLKDARTFKKEGKSKKPEDKSGMGGGAIAGIVIGSVLGLALLVGIIIAATRKKGHPHPMGQFHAQTGPGHSGQGMMMVGGRAQPAPVAKTVAIGAGGSQPIAATAFASMALGSLTCVRGQLMGQRFSLTPQGILIGRQPGIAQIVINDARASGKHVWIGYENGVLVAIDQGTTNGTFVNDVRYGRISKATLKDGDTVIVSEPDCLALQLKLT